MQLNLQVDMATLPKVERDGEEFKKEFFLRNCEAEEMRQKENQAATLIQNWFRACKVRAYYRHLHKKAVIIQKTWRGFTARARVRQMVKAAYFIMKMNFFEEMAVRIQRRWRGFFVRKYVHNFYARKGYMEGLFKKNELLRREVDELEEFQKREQACVEMVNEQKARVYQAHRLHHLLSTQQRPGVFNSPFRVAPHEMEELLKQVKYPAPTLVLKEKTSLMSVPSSTAPNFPESLESSWMKTKRIHKSKPILSPITSQKQQVMLKSRCGMRSSIQQ
ncbi:spermatogenesis-associated protein 17 [Pholidichthys leucotaenia]